MKKLFFLLAILLSTPAIKAQDSIVVVQNFYFDNTYYIVEQMPEFAGGRSGFEKYINNNIVFPKSLKDKGQVFTIECLISDKSQVLSVKVHAKETLLKEKDLYYIQNQVAQLFDNLAKVYAPYSQPPFKPAKLNGVKVYSVYKEDIKIGGTTQTPNPTVQVKHNKKFYTKPAEVHFMAVPPSIGADTKIELTKLINENVKPMPRMTGHAFKFSADVFVDESGTVKLFVYNQSKGPKLFKAGKEVTYNRGTPEYTAYDDWAEKIDRYVRSLKFTPGTVGGYPTYSPVKIDLCVGTNCPE